MVKMGKKSTSNAQSAAKWMKHQCITLSEENTGVKRASVDTVLKLQHQQKIAKWVSGEAGIPTLGAWFGCHFASSSEAEGVPIDSSCLICQSCETFLQPGFNCTIRIEKNNTRNSRRPKKKSHTSSVNGMVYTCHYCSHRNTKRGSEKGHVRRLLASRPEPVSEEKPHPRQTTNNYIEEPDFRELSHQTLPGKSSPVLADSISGLSATPLHKSLSSSRKKKKVSKLPPGSLETKKPQAVPELHPKQGSAASGRDAGTTLAKALASKKKRKAGESSPCETPSASKAPGSGTTASASSSKRRRKGWSSLKEIVEGHELEKRRGISNMAIPFSLAPAT